MMPDMHILTAFVIATLTLTLSPGPSNMYIVACTANHGPRAGISAALGMAIGSCVYVMLSAIGMSALVLHFPTVFLAIKLAGAIYLIWLGGLTIRSAQKKSQQSVERPVQRQLLRQSLIVELTNPKTILFFIAFLPQFTQPDAANITLQFVVLGMVYTILAFGSDLFMVALTSSVSRLLLSKGLLNYWQDVLAGIVLIGLGAIIIGSEIMATISISA